MVLHPDNKAVTHISDRVIASRGNLFGCREGTLVGVLIKVILSSWVPHGVTSNLRASYVSPRTANLAGPVPGRRAMLKQGGVPGNASKFWPEKINVLT
jgi:hypothetical protein